MELPNDTLQPAPTESIIDDSPIVSPQQRETDFNRAFSWHGKEINFSIASELYYRELRAHMNAPPLASYNTMADFSAEAPRVLYCAHQTAQTIRVLRMFPPAQQIEAYDQWVEVNIAIHELNEAAKVAQEIQDAIARARTQPADSGDIDGAGN